MFESIHFQTIGATDLIRARDFYRDKLGFLVERDEAYGESRWIFMQLEGAQTMLHFTQKDRIEDQDIPALVLRTLDVDAACDALKSKGVPILNGPEDAPWEPGTRWAMINDSEGNLILLQTTGDMSNG
ncbi:MAG: putative enzyme related to lactoylglutathione lyase [Halocynthiibacter sp.]|jgi:predicted enzyme related to lactoylglutathione lyase